MYCTWYGHPKKIEPSSNLYFTCHLLFYLLAGCSISKCRVPVQILFQEVQQNPWNREEFSMSILQSAVQESHQQITCLITKKNPTEKNQLTSSIKFMLSLFLYNLEQTLFQACNCLRPISKGIISSSWSPSITYSDYFKKHWPVIPSGKLT